MVGLVGVFTEHKAEHGVGRGFGGVPHIPQVGYYHKNVIKNETGTNRRVFGQEKAPYSSELTILVAHRVSYGCHVTKESFLIG